MVPDRGVAKGEESLVAVGEGLGGVEEGGTELGDRLGGRFGRGEGGRGVHGVGELRLSPVGSWVGLLVRLEEPGDTAETDFARLCNLQGGGMEGIS